MIYALPALGALFLVSYPHPTSLGLLSIPGVHPEPCFNGVGRVAAWANMSNGSGAPWFARHPLKMFNQILLVATAMRKLNGAAR